MKQERYFRCHWAKQWYWLGKFWALSFESGVGSADGRFYLGSMVLADLGLIIGYSAGSGFGGKCYSLAGNEVRDLWRFGRLMVEQDVERSDR